MLSQPNLKGGKGETNQMRNEKWEIKNYEQKHF
jgi:hypothetical protein